MRNVNPGDVTLSSTCIQLARRPNSRPLRGSGRLSNANDRNTGLSLSFVADGDRTELSRTATVERDERKCRALFLLTHFEKFSYKASHLSSRCKLKCFACGCPPSRVSQRSSYRRLC